MRHKANRLALLGTFTVLACGSPEYFIVGRVEEVDTVQSRPTLTVTVEEGPVFVHGSRIFVELDERRHDVDDIEAGDRVRVQLPDAISGISPPRIGTERIEVLRDER